MDQKRKTETKEETTMKTLPASEQPYEKVLEYGAASLSDAELLSVILRSGSKGMPARALAEKVLSLGTPDGLAGLLHHSLADYKAIRGIGDVKAIQLSCLGELSKRIWRSASAVRSPSFHEPEDIAAYYMEELRHMEQECLRLMIFNTKNLLIKELEISRGTVNASIATPRELYIEALRYRGTGIALVHNHPSGDAAPSREDCFFTRRVMEAGNLIGIPLLDHVIIGDNCYVSLRERGILEE